jgi:hypothetical protein
LRRSRRRWYRWRTSGTSSGTTSPVAGQISQQFCAIGSTPCRQPTSRQLAILFSISNSGAAGKRRAARPRHGPRHIISEYVLCIENITRQTATIDSYTRNPKELPRN